MSGCGVSGYGMSDIAANPLTESLEAARRARLRVQDPRVQMGCRLPERGQALEAQVRELASGNIGSSGFGSRGSGLPTISRSMKALSKEALTRPPVP